MNGIDLIDLTSHIIIITLTLTLTLINININHYFNKCIDSQLSSLISHVLYIY